MVFGRRQGHPTPCPTSRFHLASTLEFPAQKLPDFGRIGFQWPREPMPHTPSKTAFPDIGNETELSEQVGRRRRKTTKKIGSCFFKLIRSSSARHPLGPFRAALRSHKSAVRPTVQPARNAGGFARSGGHRRSKEAVRQKRCFPWYQSTTPNESRKP